MLPMLGILWFAAATAGVICPRRTGRLLSGSTAFFAKESGGKESAEGAPPPLHSPQCATGLNFSCGGIAPVRCHLGGSFPPMWVALYCHARQVTAKAESYRQKMGRPPKKAALLEGSGEGNEKFPSPPFLSPISFLRKEIGRYPRRVPARRAQKPPGLAGLDFQNQRMALVSTSSLSWAANPSRDRAPWSSPLRCRTETVPFSLSRSPTTSI